MQRAQHLDIAVARLSRLAGSGDIFTEMIQDDAAARVRNGGDGANCFLERFAGDEPSSEAVRCAEPRNPLRKALFRRQPEDQIA
jgi:hypothetical protein